MWTAEKSLTVSSWHLVDSNKISLSLVHFRLNKPGYQFLTSCTPSSWPSQLMLQCGIWLSCNRWGVKKTPGIMLEVWSHKDWIKGNNEFSHPAGYLLHSTQLDFFSVGLHCWVMFSFLPTQVFSAKPFSGMFALSHVVIPSAFFLNFMGFLSAHFSSFWVRAWPSSVSTTPPIWFHLCSECRSSFKVLNRHYCAPKLTFRALW